MHYIKARPSHCCSIKLVDHQVDVVLSDLYLPPTSNLQKRGREGAHHELGQRPSTYELIKKVPSTLFQTASKCKVLITHYPWGWNAIHAFSIHDFFNLYFSNFPLNITPRFLIFSCLQFFLLNEINDVFSCHKQTWK